MATRKKPLFPTIAAALLDATLKAIPPAQASSLTAEDHAAIMDETNAVALNVAKRIEAMPDPEPAKKPAKPAKPATEKK